jgi:hypothetical protein
VARRHALRFNIQVTDGGKIPRLFRAGSRLFGELSWSVSASSRPQAALGRLRYPIAFPGDQARSGHGFDISAPFIAGRARHSLSNDTRNIELVGQGRAAMAEMGQLLARAYGPALGELVRSEDPHEADREAERALVAALAESAGMDAETFERRLSLAYLAPAIVADVVYGRHGDSISLDKLTAHPIPPSWQRQLAGLLSG